MKPKTWTLPKFRLLARRLGGADVACGVLTWLWHLAATFDEVGGKLPDNDWEALLAETSVFDRAHETGALLTAGRWVDERDGSLYVHDWGDHMPMYIKDRLRKRPEISGKFREVPGSSRNLKDVPGKSNPSDSDYKSDQLISIDRIRVSEAEVAQSARAIFQAMRYRGNEGKWIWKAGALVHVGLLAEGDVMGLARVARDKSKPPAYFYRALRQNLKERGDDLKELAGRVTIEPDWPAIYPGD